MARTRKGKKAGPGRLRSTARTSPNTRTSTSARRNIRTVTAKNATGTAAVFSVPRIAPLR
jgi:hypothetical protein